VEQICLGEIQKVFGSAICNGSRWEISGNATLLEDAELTNNTNPIVIEGSLELDASISLSDSVSIFVGQDIILGNASNIRVSVGPDTSIRRPVLNVRGCIFLGGDLTINLNSVLLDPANTTMNLIAFSCDDNNSDFNSVTVTNSNECQDVAIDRLAKTNFFYSITFRVISRCNSGLNFCQKTLTESRLLLIVISLFVGMNCS
jgi:hypothetical protein